MQHLGSYDRKLLALLTSESPPQALTSMLDGDARVYVEDLKNVVLRTSGLERGAADEEPPPPYWDPKLRASQKAYHEFIVTLADAGVAGFTQECQERVGAFFVKKKNGKLRLIIGARRANFRCRMSPSMPIGGSATWATLRVPEGCSLHIGQYDVEAYFYRLGIPVEIGAYLCLDPVPSWLVH